jgi:hypothetical protein
MPKAGGTPTVIVKDNAPAYSIATSGPCVYWTTSSGGKSFVYVRSAPKSGGAPVTIASADQPSAMDIVVDETGVYWIDDTSGDTMRATK